MTAGFEWQFKSIYGNVKSKKNENFSNIKEEICSFIDDLISNNTGKKKKYSKEFKKIIDHKDMRLKEKIKYALKNNSEEIDIFIRTLYSINSLEEPSYEQIGKRLSKERNNYAHGNISAEIDHLVVLDVLVVEWLLYIMVLKEANYSSQVIKKIINKLFNRNVAL